MKSGTLTGAFALSLFALGFASASVAAAEEELRDLSGFNAITVGGGIELTIRQGTTFRVAVEADNGKHGDVITEVENSVLVIRKQGSGLFGWRDDYSVDVTLPALVSLVASGGSEVESEGLITGEQLRMTVSGGSDVELRVAVSDFATEISGGSDVELAGTAGTLHISISGGSDIDASELNAVAAEVQASGGSDVAIAVSERLVARASGGSDIDYQGNPPVVDTDTSGGAEVTQR